MGSHLGARCFRNVEGHLEDQRLFRSHPGTKRHSMQSRQTRNQRNVFGAEHVAKEAKAVSS